MAVTKSIFIFILAGLCEIGGGYLIWLWLKEGKPAWCGLLGGCILAFYGVVATWQTANFGRVYAAYGGVFVIMSLLWGVAADKYVPDKYDILGALLVLLGVCIAYYAPRT
ncbi:MAG: YnfA family protein [Lewinellaceae bacterium]|nr:YnfA family protein [Lewinellaceae bacterium]